MSIEFEIEELACRAIGMTEAQAEEAINNSGIYDLLDDKYGIDFDLYVEIVKDLLPFTPVIKAGISGKSFHGFVDNAESRFIVKIPKPE